MQFHQCMMFTQMLEIKSLHQTAYQNQTLFLYIHRLEMTPICNNLSLTANICQTKHLGYIKTFDMTFSTNNVHLVTSIYTRRVTH